MNTTMFVLADKNDNSVFVYHDYPNDYLGTTKDIWLAYKFYTKKEAEEYINNQNLPPYDIMEVTFTLTKVSNA